MAIDESRKSELKDIQAMAIDHAIEEMHGADALSIGTKEDRGDRGFLTGMAAKSFGVAFRIEQLIMLMEREEVPDDADEAETQSKAQHRLISRARAEVRQVMERAGAGSRKQSD